MDIADLLEQAKALGLEGKERSTYVTDQQAFGREERLRDRERERDERERERDEKEREREREKEEREREKEEREREEKQKDRDHELEMARLAVRRDENRNQNSNEEQTGNRHQVRSKIKIKMPFFDEKEDMDAYLRRFERVMEAQDISREEWSTHLAVLLKGKALEVYVRLSPSDASSYEIIKTALLKRYDMTEDGFRRKFRTAKLDSGETHTQFAQRLANYLDRWVQLSQTNKTYEHLCDLLLKEQLLNAVDNELALFLRERCPKTVDDMAVLAEKYREARHGWTSKRPVPTTYGKPRPNQGEGSEKSDMQVSKPKFKPMSERICFACNKKGHLARDCKNASVIVVATPQEGTIEHESHVRTCSYMDQDIRILRDSGSTTTCIKKSLLPADVILGEPESYVGINGVQDTVPTAQVYLETPYFQGNTKALVFLKPPFDVIIGNIPGARSPDNPDPRWKELVIHKIAIVETRAQKQKDKLMMKPLVVTDIDMDKVDASYFRKEQAKDESLDRFRAIAQQSTDSKYPAFIQQAGLLMRKYCSPTVEQGKMFSQLVVPTTLREKVMRMGHETLMAGHLAARKSLDRIQRHFYWPGIQADIRRFCASCDVCQRTVGKGKTSKVPLGKMPLIDTPFDRVAVDLIGPLDPVTDRKNRYILTLVDYATRYPEAVALRNIDTETVAEALVGMFSRVGIPKEILTDMGTQFTSDLMKEVGRLLSLKQLTTTPYHPMCNGLVERFNGTLKGMLKKMCAEKPKEWDRYIMPLLFAYREVPQESLGFSPFELLYGRTVRGPMSILRDLWADDIDDAEVKTTYQYIVDLKQRLHETCQMAHDNLQKSSDRYKKYYNTKAKDRRFAVNDKVLLLLPTSANKLLMHWKGPYEVIGKQGLSDYHINMNGKSKLFHANLLKMYYDRSETQASKTPKVHKVCAVITEDVECEIQTEMRMEPPSLKRTETINDAHINPDLTPDQHQEVIKLLTEFDPVMTDVPGKTTLTEISLTLTTTEPVRSKAYPVPYHYKDTVVDEIKQMLRMNIIEPSQSPYASPIVLIKKPDGSVRFCTDYRKLNKVTLFDSEPIPNVEELFTRLSKAKYLTKVDLSKGYWQIPVAENSREMIAFVTPHGLFQWKVMPFGLVNAPAVFSRMMRTLLDGLDDIENYIDDILVATETWENHVCIVRQLLTRLLTAGLTARPSKCYFGYHSLEFLGHVVGKGELKPEVSKVDNILNISRPQNKKQMRSFLGTIGYYRKFVPNFSAMAAPLTDMTRKGSPAQLDWSPVHVRTFEALKKLMSTAPILRLPDLDRPFVLRTDASDRGLGAVLLQEYEEDIFPVLYLSRKLNKAEVSYAVIEKECLAIVWAVNKLQLYLHGREFQLETDHQPLVWLNTAKISNARVMRWALLLQPYRFVIRSIEGLNNVGADLLSRCGGASSEDTGLV